MTNLTIWVLALPLLGFIILGLAGRALTRTGILTVALGTSGLAFLFAALGFLSMLGAPPTSPTSGDQVFYTWVNSGFIGTVPGVPAGAASGGGRSRAVQHLPDERRRGANPRNVRARDHPEPRVRAARRGGRFPALGIPVPPGTATEARPRAAR